MDGIHVFGAQNVDILNNRFYGVECQAIFFEQGGPPTMNANVNIIGNAISNVSGGCGNAGIILEFATGTANFGGTWNIAFNSGTSYIHSGNSGLSSFIAGSKLNFAGNYMNNQTCDSSTANVTVTYSYNLWLNSNCGGATNSVGTTPSFVDSNGSPDPNIDVHLASSSGTAINFVPLSFCTANPSLCPTTDIDGQTRPAGAAYEAGADESGSSGSLQGDLNSDGHVTILDLSILLSHYSQAATAAQGDINNDGTVTILDLSILLSHYGT
jgi:hypothetical protein